ncbi:MAG: DUF4954 family protein [Paludibacteraceae bacterium]|nr:DUF4954 family protein [Paludibacteraceae bacterium]MBQ8704713.1 DUF4954 family protein [Paludibacteraceae bacterium]
MYRSLTSAEIAQLELQGCSAENWAEVEVAEAFDAQYVRNTRFSGHNRIGVFRRQIEMPGGLKVHSGIYNATLHNVEVGDDAHLYNIHNYIANYRIGCETCIENVNAILVDGKTTFGNGVRVPVMNEGGGREIPIFNELSASLAYILTLYRHRPEMIHEVERLIDEYAERQASEVGYIGDHVRILNCGSIKNVKVGDFAELVGVSRLKNGTVNSNEHAPVRLGSGVKCVNFIIASGVEIGDSTLVDKCFVGQGCVFDKHYSAGESLFFSNCQGMHGEACAIFAGPYTVTHHKSTLLIAGMFSFLNAGSGSNQSNHMYKLGPIHQGVAERGAKTTSDSYLLWPSKIGAFSLVMGRHTHHADTSELPFSYLIENNSESYLVPGANLRTVGTIRDAQKWPKRDNRKDPHKIDQINFNLLSPYTVQKMWRGREVLNELQALSGENTDVYGYRNCKIRNSSLRHGRELYTIGIQKFLGNSLISRLEQKEWHTLAEIRAALRPDSRVGLGDWVDLAGLIAPKSEVSVLLDDIEKGHMTLEDIQARLVQMHANYYSYEWTWALEKLEQVWGCSVEEVSLEQIRMTVNQWLEAVVNLDRMVYNDARKEFDLNSQTGFGVDGDREQAEADFEEVRGSFESNSFVKAVLEHIERKSALGERMLERLSTVNCEL